MKTVFYGIALGFGMKLGASIYRGVDRALARRLWDHRDSIDTLCEKYKINSFDWECFAPKNHKEDSKPTNKIGF